MNEQRLKTLLFNSIICLVDELGMTIEESKNFLKSEIGITDEEFEEIMKY